MPLTFDGRGFPVLSTVRLLENAAFCWRWPFSDDNRNEQQISTILSLDSENGTIVNAMLCGPYCEGGDSDRDERFIECDANEVQVQIVVNGRVAITRDQRLSIGP